MLVNFFSDVLTGWSTNDLDDIRHLPEGKVFSTQWNDGPIQPKHPDYYEDCMANRFPPGQGEFALVELIRVLDEIGSTAPLGLEVCSTKLWAAPVDVAANASADGMREVLAIARG